MDEKYADYDEAIEYALNKLSALYNIDLHLLIENIKTVNYDILSIRFNDKNASDGFLRLDEISDYIKAIKDLIVSSACAIIDPKIFYRNPSSYKYAKDIANKSQFRQTNTGSFAINVALPIENRIYNSLFINSNESFTRKVTANIAKSLEYIIDNIETDTMENLSNSEHIISSNFCDSIYSFYDEECSDVEFGFRWSPKLPFDNKKITVKKEYFNAINAFSEFLKENKSESISGTFMATVETLNGDFNENNNVRH